MSARRRLTEAVHRARFLLIATFAVLALLAALIVKADTPVAYAVGGPAAATGDHATLEEGLAALRDSRELDGAPLVAGHVVSESGAAADAGTTVYVQLWPSPDKLAAIETGETFDLEPIAKAETAADGTFEVRIDPRVPVRSLMGDSEFVDADLVVGTGKDRTTYSFSLGRADVQSLLPDVAFVDATSRTAARGIEVDVTLGGAGTLVGVDDPPVEEEPTQEGVVEEEATPEPGSAPSAVAEADDPPYVQCPSSGTKKIAHLGDRWVNVGNVFAAGGSGKKIRYEYSGTADSSLGVGVSSSGRYGTFEAGGSITRERAFGIGWGEWSAPKRRYLDTKFSYGKYCTTTRNPGPGPTYTFYAKAIQHRGGARHRVVDNYPSNLTHCNPWSAGTYGSKSNSNATTWSSGAKTSGAIGINLSSRTGFRTDSELHWKFDTRGRLCGRSDVPAGNPKVIGMKGW